MADILTNEKIQKWIEEDKRRDMQQRGLYERFVLKPASSFDWADPRMANGVPILARKARSTASVNHRLHTPFDRQIANQKASYFASNITTTFGETIPQSVIDMYEEIESTYNLGGILLEAAESCADRGNSYILCFNNNGRVGVTSSLEWHSKVLYDPLTGIPTLGIRYYQDSVEVYDGTMMYRYSRNERGEVFFIDSEPHGFGTTERPGIPLIELPNNFDRLGNVEMTLSLQDAYDVSLSDLSSEVAQMRLAYLLLKGLGQDKGKIKDNIKEAGILLVDAGDGDAKFVTKDLKVEGVKLLLDTTRGQIFEGASSYDPNAFLEGSSPTAYQVAQRLHPLEQDVQRTIGEWVRGLNYYDYILQTFFSLFSPVGDYNIKDINRVFSRNIPKNILGSLKEVRDAGGIIANDIILEQSGLQIDLERNRKLIME